MPLPKPVQLTAAIIFIARSISRSLPRCLQRLALRAHQNIQQPRLGLMLKMPADFSAYPPNATPERDETGAPTGQAIVLQNTSGTAVQIEVTPDTREVSNSTKRSAPSFQSSAFPPPWLGILPIGIAATNIQARSANALASFSSPIGSAQPGPPRAQRQNRPSLPGVRSASIIPCPTEQ
jgi:hypothetical protein